MTPEQALDLLTQVTAAVQANRQTHAQIAEALKVLKEAIKKSNG
jgi:hypothetical protein